VRMARAHVGIPEVVQAVQKRTQDIPAGYIRSFENQRLVRVMGQVKSADEMRRIVVRSNFQGEKIQISDIADVKDGAEDPIVNTLIDGEPATLMVVTKKPSAD